MLSNTLDEMSARLSRLCTHNENVLPPAQRGSVHVARLRDHAQQVAKELQALKEKLSDKTDMNDIIATTKAVDKELQKNVDGCIVQFSLDKIEPNSPLSFCIEKYLTQTVLSVIGIRTLAQNMNAIYKATLPCQAEARRPPSVLQPDCSIEHLVEHVTDNVSALCMEKHGVFPKIAFKSKDRLELLCVPGHLAFVLTEVLKNATSAMIKRYGIDADQAEPIVITAGGDDNEVAIRVSDKGPGMSFHHTQEAFKWFFTTAPKGNESYVFSGDFAGQLEGKGVGLPLARTYAKFMGGDLHLQSIPKLGTDAFIYLQRNPRF